MASTATPFGLRPVNLIGGQPYNGGAIREFRLPSNVALAYYTGAVIRIDTNGVPTPLSATITTGTTAGVVGVCVGVRYVDPTLKYTVFAQSLPSGAITAGYTDVWIRVNDDPNQLYMIQAATTVGTKTNGARGAIGQNAALTGFSGSAATGLANTALDTGTNWGSCASTATLAMRIVDVITPDDAYPELLVKFNGSAHSYNFVTGV